MGSALVPMLTSLWAGLPAAPIAMFAAAVEPGAARIGVGEGDAPAPLLPPAAVLTADDGVRIYQIALSPDGSTAVASVELNTVNLWAVAVYYGPEAAAGIVALLLVLYLRRVLRDKSVVGQEHCRRCFYQLRGLAGDRCPECGTELTAANRVVGRRKLVRLLVSTTCLAVLTGWYCLYSGDLPRKGRVSEWLGWESAWAYERAKGGTFGWVPYLIERTAVVELDMTDGSVRRVIRRSERGSWEWQLDDLIVANDGGSFFTLRCGNTANGGIRQYDAESGSQRRLFVSALPEARAIEQLDLVDSGRTLVLPITSYVMGGKYYSSYAEIALGAWDVHDGAPIARGPGLTRDALASSCAEASYARIRIVGAHTAGAADLSVSADGRRVAVLAPDRRTIHVLDTSEFADQLRRP
jgi:hypothetical protein